MTDSPVDWPELLTLATRELRMPLNAVLGWVELLKTGGLDGERTHTALATIERNARLQASLIDDLLELARLGAGRLTLERRALDAASLAAAAAEAGRPLADEKQVLIERSIDPGTLPIAGDATRLQKALGHLIAAAIKAAPSGGVIELSAGRADDVEVQLGVRARGETLMLDGVRLRLVEELMRLHGGRLMIEGGRAALVLPRHGTTGAVEATPGPPLAGVRVLVVDDEADAREVLAALLAQRGAEVRAAASAADAIALVSEWRPDVLVSDIGMPGEDGFALIGRVRALGEAGGGWLPALALTAYASTEDARRALLAGFQHHLSKPVDGASLARAIAALLPR
jgi:CheY-like chemotaxis protein